MPSPSTNRLTALAAGAAAGAFAGAAAAQTATSGAPSFSFGAGASSDYVYRGASRTEGRGQGFASAAAGFSDAYAGVWASNVALRGAGGTLSAAEVDVYGGWRPEVMGYSLDLGAQYDAFTGQPAGAALDYGEVYAKVSRSVGPVTGRLGLHYSPAYADHAGQAWYGEAGADYAFARDWTVSAGAGYQTIEHRQAALGPSEPALAIAGDYATWNAGVTRAVGDHLAVDLRYFDTDHHGYGPGFGSKLVGQIRASF
ncbi:MAG: TorF family putative porin [Caulobacteraceae bacterium]|nr:TorF family putative porin [Caulobacteraceae bacterium]